MGGKPRPRWGILARVRPEEIVGAPLSSGLLYADSPRDELASRGCRLNNRPPRAPIQGHAPWHARSSRVRWSPCSSPRRPPDMPRSRRPPPRPPPRPTPTTSTTTTTVPSTTAPPSTGAAPTTPKPDPDAFAALANQVSQNQAMLAQLTAQVDADRRSGSPALGGRDRRDAAKLDATRAETEQLKQLVRDARRVHLPTRRRTADRGGRHRARAGHQCGEEYAESADADRRHQDLDALEALRSARRRTASSSRPTAPSSSSRRTGSTTPRRRSRR